MGHPAVAEAAVIAVPDEKWDERPLAVVVLKQGQTATPRSCAAYLAPQFAKWWLPDAVRVRRRDPEDGRRQVPQDGACASSSPSSRRLPMEIRAARSSSPAASRASARRPRAAGAGGRDGRDRMLDAEHGEAVAGEIGGRFVATDVTDTGAVEAASTRHPDSAAS